MKIKNTNCLHSAIWGLIVGDALGVPFEFKSRDKFEVTDMVGYGTHNQPVGTWSDDSSMTLATIASLCKQNKIDFDDIMEQFANWYYDACYCPYDEVFDIGGTTLSAIEQYKNGTKSIKCGGNRVFDNGNGSLMRILPIAFVEHTVMDIVNLSSLTHAHEISLLACRYYVQVAEKLMNGAEKTDAVKSLDDCEGQFIRLPQIASYPRDKIKSSGFVIDTLEAALWCLLTTENYKDCVLTAVALGDDTDTVAAVAGGLAGIYYGTGGEKGIPEEWINKLAKKEWINELLNSFIQLN